MPAPLLDLEAVKKLFEGPPHRPKHKLKWKLPEVRMTAQVEDAEKTVALVRKIAAFKAGGEFRETVYFKEHYPQIYSYFTVRADKKTENEKLLFDGYMLQEEEKIDVDLAVAFEVEQNLKSLGYDVLFPRELTEWAFLYLMLPVKVQDVDGFGAFVELALPATDVETDRKKAEKMADLFFKRLGFAKEQVVPTDIVTLQLVLLQQEMERQKQAEGPQGGLGAKQDFRL